MNLNDAFERFCIGAGILLLMLLFLCIVISCAGCRSDKASHQHGLVLYGGLDGRVGIGYGETEDVPLGSVYLRHVYQTSPSFFWQREGTNVTASLTIWNTCGASTNNAAHITVQPCQTTPSQPTPSER